MSKLFPHSQHYLRVVGLFIGGLLLFILLRAVFIPKGFGELGHYRVGSLADNRNKPLSFAGRKACLECHTDVGDAQKGSRHEALSCEACHGAQNAHATAADPSASKPKKPAGAEITHLCLNCHEANAAKPKGFKQVEARTHMGGGACADCHSHHAPQVIKGSEPAKKGAETAKKAAEPAKKAAAKEVKP